MLTAADRFVDKEKKRLTTHLILGAGLLAVLLLAAVAPGSSLPTAENLGVDNTNGYQYTTAVVPVVITNAQNGPIISILFDILYDTNVTNLTAVQPGTLTASWDSPVFHNFAWETRFLLVYDGNASRGIQNGTSGSVALLIFELIGTSGSTSQMNLSNIQLSDTGYTVGTAPPKNGTLIISTSPSPPSPSTSPPTPIRGDAGGGGSTTGSGSSWTIPALVPKSAPSAGTPTPHPSQGAARVPNHEVSPTLTPTAPIKPPFLGIRMLAVMGLFVALMSGTLLYLVLDRRTRTEEKEEE